jgi:hypothetical protein
MNDVLDKYYEHAISCLIKKRDNSIRQSGKSNIEPISYAQNTNEWFDKLVRLLENDPPKYYVRHFLIDQNDNREILSYKYDYYEIDDIVKDMSLIITLV